MKSTKTRGLAAALAAVLLTTACNTNDGYQTDPTDFSAAEVKGFALRADKAVLNNLDSVFFSIDQVNARIFNADSLPVGTKVSALGVKISVEQVSEASLYYLDGEGTEHHIDYLTTPEEKMSFATRPVRLHLVSQDGSFARDYTIEVNVHRVKSDSLYWDRLARRDLPTTLPAPTAQKTVRSGNTLYSLATDGTSYTLARTDDPYADEWTVAQAVDLPKAVDVRSLAGADGLLAVLATDGSLLVSDNGGRSWTDSGEAWHSITASYGKQVLGIKQIGTSFVHTAYPASTEVKIDTDFPVSGASSQVEFTTKWAEAPQIMVVGGRRADGSLSNATWAYDGEQWACISRGLPAGEGYALTSCPVCVTDTVNWRTIERPVMLAFGGLTDRGVSRTVYVSNDQGLTWRAADEYLQLPDYIPATYRADALTVASRLSLDTPAGGAKAPWQPVGNTRPLWLADGPWSRAIEPVTEWECPFIYLFGGVDDSGALQPFVWRGVINHFTFRPLY